MIKSIASLIIFITLTLHAHAQATFPEVVEGRDVLVPRDLRGRYWGHAANLAWEWLRETRSPDTASIVLPEKLVNSLYNTLIHIHNASGPEHDSAITCGIRTWSGSRFYWVQDLTIDLRKAPWAKAWLKEKKRTGNATIDRIMKEYGLTPHIRNESKRELVVDFSTENATQMWRVADQLLKVKGISREDMIMAVADEGAITARADGTSWIMAYRCGAMNGFNEWRLSQTIWHFKVYPDGRVVYQGREGSLRSE